MTAGRGTRRRFSRFHDLTLASTFAVLVGAMPVQAASDADAVSYRRHVMKTMGEQAAALGLVLQERGPAENAAVHARILALTAEAALKAFEPPVPGGEARPEIWTNWSDFTRRLKELSQGAVALAETAQHQSLDEVRADVMKVLSCKSCHDAYTLRQGR